VHLSSVIILQLLSFALLPVHLFMFPNVPSLFRLSGRVPFVVLKILFC
jgi:hypothetical protein